MYVINRSLSYNHTVSSTRCMDLMMCITVMHLMKQHMVAMTSSTVFLRRWPFFSSGLCHDSDKYSIGTAVVVFMKKHRKCDIELTEITLLVLIKLLLGLIRMAATLQMVFSNDFVVMKSFVFLFEFHLNVFQGVTSIIKPVLFQLVVWHQPGYKTLHEIMMNQVIDWFTRHQPFVLMDAHHLTCSSKYYKSHPTIYSTFQWFSTQFKLLRALL